MKDQQMHFNCIEVLLLCYGHQRVSVFRVIYLRTRIWF